jgi:hypothetical protein
MVNGGLGNRWFNRIASAAAIRLRFGVRKSAGTASCSSISGPGVNAVPQRVKRALIRRLLH